MLFKNIHMPYAKTTLFMMLGCCLFSMPASAATQKDIQSCRIAIATQGTYDISEHRLRYVSQKGKRNRVIKLEAIPNKSGERYKLTCHLDRKNKVVAINEQPFSKLARGEIVK